MSSILKPQEAQVHLSFPGLQPPRTTKPSLASCCSCLPGLPYPVLPRRKSDQGISKPDFYQTTFLPKIKPKLELTSLFFRSKSELFQKHDSDIRHSNFYLPKKSKCKRKFKYIYFFFWCGRLESENLTCWFFQGQKRTFQAKKRTNLGAYF